MPIFFSNKRSDVIEEDDDSLHWSNQSLLFRLFFLPVCGKGDKWARSMAWQELPSSLNGGQLSTHQPLRTISHQDSICHCEMSMFVSGCLSRAMKNSWKRCRLAEMIRWMNCRWERIVDGGWSCFLEDATEEREAPMEKKKTFQGKSSLVKWFVFGLKMAAKIFYQVNSYFSFRVFEIGWWCLWKIALPLELKTF